MLYLCKYRSDNEGICLSIEKSKNKVNIPKGLNMKINCMLFDLDGTLINTNELVIQSFLHTMRVHFNREHQPQDFIPYFGEPLVTTLERFAPGQVEELLKTYRAFNLEKHDDLTTHFVGIDETLRQLAENGITLGVVTSKLKATALRGLHLMGLDGYFPVVVAYEDTAIHKPKGEPILKALELLQHDKQGVLYVGDSTYDIRCAHDAGVLSAAVMWSAHARESLLAENPDYAIETPAELLQMVLDK